MTNECCWLRWPRARLFILVAALLFSTLSFQASTYAQGSLIPPDEPGPTMKSLDQVEARTIVNATNTPGDETNTFIISQPGSYYLTGNITGEPKKHGISIQANDVTLDLNGFALSSGGGGALRGVDVPVAQKNLSLRNGTIRGWTGGGVRADLASNTLAEKLRLSDNTNAEGLSFGNGTARDCVATGNGTGFILGNGAQIRDCAATANSYGFVIGERAMATSCISTENSFIGYEGANFVTLTDCTAGRNFGPAGIRVQGGSSVIHCDASRNIPTASGIIAGEGCTVTDCTTASNGSIGIDADVGSTIQNCTANANGNNGIFTDHGVVTGCTSAHNGGSGISNSSGSTSNCAASFNGSNGINTTSGVVAFCLAVLNNGSQNINAVGSTRTGNNPGP